MVIAYNFILWQRAFSMGEYHPESYIWLLNYPPDRENLHLTRAAT
jgi:hypothetical protein